MTAVLTDRGTDREPDRRTDRLPTALVLTLLSATALAVTDAFITFVAAPSLALDLHLSDGELELVVATYVVAYAALMLAGARAGQRYGVRRTFRVGLTGFALASAACACAWSPVVLLGARTAQGVAAGLMVPQVLSGFRRYLGDAHRTRAMAWFGCVVGASAALAQMLGGALISLDLGGWGWRWCFAVNLPVALVGVVAAGRVLPRTEPDRRVSLDLPGITLGGVALAALVLAATEGRAEGWPAWALGAPFLTLVLGGWFARRQRHQERAGASPLVPPALLREPGVAWGGLTQLAAYAGVAGFYLPLGLALQVGLGLSPMEAGLVCLPSGLAFWRGSALGARHAGSGRGAFRIAAVALVGWCLVGAAVLHAARHSPSLAVVVIGAAGYSALLGYLGPTCLGLVLARVPEEHAGAAGGVLATGQQVGNALGLAAAGGALYAVAGSHPAGPALFDGVAAALVVLAGASALLAIGLRGLLAASTGSR